MNKYLEIGVEEFRKSFNQSVAEFPEGRTARAAGSGRGTKAYPNGEDRLWWEDQGPAFIQSWISWRQQNVSLHLMNLDGKPAIEVEVQAEISLPDDTTVLLRGFIDRVFVDANSGQALIVDLKTGKTSQPPLQLAFYRRALRATYDITVDLGAYWMARKGSLDTVHDLTSFSDDMIDYWVRTTYLGIREGIFLPHVTQLCSGCGVKQHCYVFNSDSSFSPLKTNIALEEASDNVID